MPHAEWVSRIRPQILDGHVEETEGAAEAAPAEAWTREGFTREAVFELILVLFEALRDRKKDAVLRGLRLAGLVQEPTLFNPVIAIYDLASISIEPSHAGEIRHQALKALWTIGAVAARWNPVHAAQAKAFWLTLLDSEDVLYAFQGLRRQDPACAVEHVNALLYALPAHEEEVRLTLHAMVHEAKEKGLDLRPYAVVFLQQHPVIMDRHRDLIRYVFHIDAE